MISLRLFIIFLFVFSLIKIILFYCYFKNFKPPTLTKDEIEKFDKDDDAFFEEDDF